MKGEPLNLRSLAQAHVGILGFARGGQALARWLVGRAKAVTVSDRRGAEQLGVSLADFPGVDWRLADPQQDLPEEWQLLFVSGGVPGAHPYIRAARAAGIPITNDAQLFLAHCPAPVIGITGSAGKTTTTCLVGDMLRAAGETVWVGGNIGHVLLDDLAEMKAGDVVVMELSSFQLEWMSAAPQVAAILNLSPNHLDRHGTMAAYIEAKARILNQQGAGARAVFSADDDECVRLAAARARGSASWFGVADHGREGVFLDEDWLVLREGDRIERICPRADIGLRGMHNLRNVLAACAIARAYGAATAAMARAIRRFQPIAHRLQEVREFAGVRYVNDSIATSPERTMAALASYAEPLVLLLGGQDKQLPWRPMLRQARDKARALIAFGEAAPMIAAEWAALPPNEVAFHQAADLSAAVALARQLAQKGDVVLLSPGGTSYDAYPDFEARGRHFHDLVMSL